MEAWVGVLNHSSLEQRLPGGGLHRGSGIARTCPSGVVLSPPRGEGAQASLPVWLLTRFPRDGASAGVGTHGSGSPVQPLGWGGCAAPVPWQGRLALVRRASRGPQGPHGAVHCPSPTTGVHRDPFWMALDLQGAHSPPGTAFRTLGGL